MATDMYLPSFPALAHDLDVSPAAVQATITAYLIPLAFGQLLFGALSDAHGRRPFVVGGSLLLICGSVVAALAPTLEVLMAGRVMQGIGGAATVVSGRAMVADLLSERVAARAYIAIGTAAGLGPVLAPTIGAWLEHANGWRAIFWTIALTQVALLLVALKHAESHPPALRTRGPLRSLGQQVSRVWTIRAYRWQVVVATASFVALFAYISASPFVAEELGLSTASFTAFFAVNGVGLIAFSTASAALVVRVGRRRITSIALAISLSGATLIALGALGVATLPSVLLGMFLLVAPCGSVTGNAYSLAASAVPGSTGVSLALMGTVQFIAGGLVAVLVGVAAPVTTSLAVAALAGGLTAALAHAMAGRR